MIKKGDIVFHRLSRMYFKCENAKMEKWMNMNSFYEETNDKIANIEEYFNKDITPLSLNKDIINKIIGK